MAKDRYIPQNETDTHTEVYDICTVIAFLNAMAVALNADSARW